MQIVPLRPADVSLALHLSTLAGWNQTEADWRRLLNLAPDGCLGGWVEGTLAATATLVTFGRRVGWIGMVLVHPEHRRHGYGRRIFEEILRRAPEDAVETLGLDATDLGRPLYQGFGFVDAAPINRWDGTLPYAALPDAVAALTPADLERLARFDRSACGADRRGLLAHLLQAAGGFGLALDGPEGLRGYALVRPGRTAWQIGPLVAGTPGDAAALLQAAGARLEGAPVLVDAVEHPERSALLHRAGLRVQRRLVRMTRGRADVPLTGGGVIAAAGLEWG